mgnify:CR=1 FL=1
MFERGPLLFVFNWSPIADREAYRVAVPAPGKWRVALDSDAWDYGGAGRVRGGRGQGGSCRYQPKRGAGRRA